MNVSSWNIKSRMKLPDWCFGNRDVIGARVFNNAVGTRTWAISEGALPDPACIWQIRILSSPTPTGKGDLRMGLAATVPASEAQMNAALDFMPNVGMPKTGPNAIRFHGEVYQQIVTDIRMGLVTDGKKLVLENYCDVALTRFKVWLVVSELPTKIPAWPGAWPAG